MKQVRYGVVGLIMALVLGVSIGEGQRIHAVASLETGWPPAGVGIITTFAGGALRDGAPATAAVLSYPRGLAFGPDGTLYIADTFNQRIRRVGLDGIITTIAGTGESGYSGDGGPATAAALFHPSGMIVEPDGGVIFADGNNHRIRRIDPNGRITTIAGTGEKAYSGDGGPALAAALQYPAGIARGWDGALYIADMNNYRVRRVGSDGIITTVAGGGTLSEIGDGGPAVEVILQQPQHIAIGPDGALYISDRNNGRVRRVGSDGIITTFAVVPWAEGLTFDRDGALLVGCGSSTVCRVGPEGSLTTVAGGEAWGYGGDGGPATLALLADVTHMAIDSQGALYIADTRNHRIRRVGRDGIITTVAGGALGDGGPADQSALYFPNHIAVGPDGVLYLADTSHNRIRRIGIDGIITTVAGNGANGYSGDGGPATAAAFRYPGGVAVGPDGALYIADTANHRIRRVGLDGIITTVAGNGIAAFAGDGGPALAASFQDPEGVAVGPDGALYIADTYNLRVRRVGADGIITTVAGNGNYNGDLPDSGPATSVPLSLVRGVYVAQDGMLYITASGFVLRVGQDGIMTKIAGGGYMSAGADRVPRIGDGGPATAAVLNNPRAVAIAPDGVVYIADTETNRVRRVGRDGIITTFAGIGQSYFPGFISEVAGYSGDGRPAVDALLAWPSGLAIGMDGALYIGDSYNHRIRRVALVEPARITLAMALEGRPPLPSQQGIAPVQVTIVTALGQAPVFNGRVNTDTLGRFALTLTPGTYRVRVQGASTLARVVEMTLVAGENQVQVPTLRTGDANGDNVVNITDFSVLAGAFGRAEGQPGFDPRADFNADGAVNVTDFALLAGAFGQAGDPWP